MVPWDCHQRVAEGWSGEAWRSFQLPVAHLATPFTVGSLRVQVSRDRPLTESHHGVAWSMSFFVASFLGNWETEPAG